MFHIYHLFPQDERAPLPSGKTPQGSLGWGHLPWPGKVSWLQAPWWGSSQGPRWACCASARTSPGGTLRMVEKTGRNYNTQRRNSTEMAAGHAKCSFFLWGALANEPAQQSDFPQPPRTMFNQQDFHLQQLTFFTKLLASDDAWQVGIIIISWLQMGKQKTYRDEWQLYAKYRSVHMWTWYS